MLYKLSTQCKCYMGTEQTHRPRSCSRKHFNAESNLLDVLGKSSFHTALKNALSLPLHCPVGKLTHLLVLSPYTQGMVNVLNKRDTYADILELLWEYLPLMSLPLTTLLVSENRSICSLSLKYTNFMKMRFRWGPLPFLKNSVCWAISGLVQPGKSYTLVLGYFKILISLIIFSPFSLLSTEYLLFSIGPLTLA